MALHASAAAFFVVPEAKTVLVLKAKKKKKKLQYHQELHWLGSHGKVKLNVLVASEESNNAKRR